MLMLLHRKITEHIREKDEKKETRVIHRRREFSGCDKKKDWKASIREGCINFCLTYLQDKQEALKICTEAVRPTLTPEGDLHIITKVVNWCLACTLAEKSPQTSSRICQNLHQQMHHSKKQKTRKIRKLYKSCGADA